MIETPKPVVSVIVPVYKVEKYLDRCIKSILSQTMSNFELILIDDGSPDKCGEICDDWKNKDARIQVIHKKNGGLSSARNAGLAIAKGDYIAFIDSDDWVESDFLEQMYNSVIKFQADLAVCGLWQEFFDKDEDLKRKRIVLPPEMLSHHAMETVKSISDLDFNGVFAYACNKLYRLQVIRQFDLKFESVELIEDYLFNINFFEKAAKIISLRLPLFHYFKPSFQTLSSSNSHLFFNLANRRYEIEKMTLIKHGIYNKMDRINISAIHIKHVISSIVRFCKYKNHLSFKERYSLTKNILLHKNTKEACKYAYRKSLLFFFLCIFIKLHFTIFIMIAQRIYMVLKE